MLSGRWKKIGCKGSSGSVEGKGFIKEITVTPSLVVWSGNHTGFWMEYIWIYRTQDGLATC